MARKNKILIQILNSDWVFRWWKKLPKEHSLVKKKVKWSADGKVTFFQTEKYYFFGKKIIRSMFSLSLSQLISFILDFGSFKSIWLPHDQMTNEWLESLYFLRDSSWLMVIVKLYIHLIHIMSMAMAIVECFYRHHQHYLIIIIQINHLNQKLVFVASIPMA